MSFTLTPEALDWLARLARFVEDELMPWEVEAELNDGELPAEVRDRHVAIAQEMDLAGTLGAAG